MARKQKPLVSIVTPFHNTADYLAECIESVLAQSYPNWEYILVNNYSTDGSFEIASRYAQKEPRIRLINTAELLSQVQNYNCALRHIAQGSKFCKIVQADDWIFPDCVTRMVAVADPNPSVGIVSSYYLSGSKVEGDGLPYPSTVMPGRDICRLQLMTNLFCFGSPTSVMCRSDLVRVNDPFYDESALHEDTEVCYQLLQHCDFGFVHQVLSFKRTSNESISSAVRTFNPHGLDKLIIVRKYGSVYLTDAEFQRCYKETSNRYFRFLGRSIFCFKGEAFWNYHRKGLATIGYDLRAWKLAKYIFLALLDMVLNPKKTAGLALRFLRKNRLLPDNRT